MGVKYFIITYGCQMNKADSERIATSLEKKGYKPASKITEADLIVVNMCSVRQSAVDRILGISQKLNEFKLKNPKLKTVLTGCILKSDKSRFRERFDAIWEGKEDLSSSSPFATARVNKDYMDILPKRQNKSLGFIPISNGCNNFCSYCVVPFVRGPLVCRDHREILKEVKRAVNPIRNAISNGAREIWLLGQNVNDYNSPTNSSINFPKLLKMVNEIPGGFQIRFMSPNPKNFSNELIDVMAKSKKIAKFLNLPIQSGDNKILKKMNRPYTVEQYKSLVKKIREKIPNINLTTDVIIGFPGESKSQFENTVKLFKEVKFNLAYVSKYSPRQGTAAFKMKDNVSLEEKKRREKILREIIEKNKGADKVFKVGQPWEKLGSKSKTGIFLV